MVSNTYDFASAWLLLHVYVLDDVVGFGIVLYYSGVFEYVFVYGGWEQWPVAHICKPYLCTP